MLDPPVFQHQPTLLPVKYWSYVSSNHGRDTPCTMPGICVAAESRKSTKSEGGAWLGHGASERRRNFKSAITTKQVPNREAVAIFSYRRR